MTALLSLTSALVLAQAPAPYAPPVEDPALAPVEAPRVVLEGWEEAFARLAARSTDERAAAANVERAEGRVRQSLAALLPQARLTAGVAYDLLNPDVAPNGIGAGARGAAAPTTPVGTAAVSLAQALVDVGAWKSLDASEAARDASLARLDDVRRRVTQVLARALVAVVGAERRAELNRVGLRLALEEAAMTERTAQLGAATQLDVVRVRQDLELARGTVVAGDEQLRRAREVLGILLGERGEVGVRPGLDLAGLVADARARCPALGSPQERPDLVAARRELDAARAAERAATWGYAPTLGLASTLSAYTTDPGPGRFASWSIAAVLAVPLWEGGLRGGLVREREGAVASAAASLDDATREAATEVDRARRAVGVAERLLVAAAEARSLAEKTDQLTRRSFEIGRATSLELVQTAVALRQADLTLATREYELVQARLDAVLTEATCRF